MRKVELAEWGKLSPLGRCFFVLVMFRQLSNAWFAVACSNRARDRGPIPPGHEASRDTGGWRKRVSGGEKGVSGGWGWEGGEKRVSGG